MPKQNEEHQISDNNDEVFKQIEALYRDDKLLQAARLLRQVSPRDADLPLHEQIVSMAQDLESSTANLISDPHSTWTRQGGHGGMFPTNIYYAVDDETRLTCRIDSVIPSSLLVPLLSVLNETDLYHTWIPTFTNLGLRSCEKLSQDGRAQQTIRVTCDLPWPMSAREAVLKVRAVDDIDDEGMIVVRIETGRDVAVSDEAVVLVDFEGSMLFRACPDDHELVQSVAREDSQRGGVLVSFKMFADCHLTMVPLSLVNYVTKSVIGQVWNILLRVAEDIKEMKRPLHREAILGKPELYDWIRSRTEIMLRNMEDKGHENTSTNASGLELVAYLQG